MKPIRILKTATLALAMLCLVACKDDIEKGTFRFGATIEQLSPDVDTKTYFVDEHWIYWQSYDRISVGGNFDNGSEKHYADLVSTTDSDYEDYNGVFISYSMDAKTNYFLGLFPYSENNVIIGSGSETSSNFPTVKIDLPATQPYDASDITFARNVFPMVAWYGGHWDDLPGSTPYNLNFHSLACIVRLQLFNQSGTDKTIDHITITATDGKKLSGLFDVVGYKSYDTVHVVPTTSASNTVTLGGGSGVEFNRDSLRSFYLVLPATSGTETMVYTLRMDVVTTDGLHCQKSFQVKVRRNGITYMRALGITGWNATNGSAVQGLVGNGTKERPFKIYTTAELTYMRDAFNTASDQGGYANGHYAKINGQTLDGNDYYFVLMNTDTLTPTNWATGIKNFYCHLDYTISDSTRPAIVNNSQRPIFDTISAGAVVHGVSVSRTYQGAISGSSNANYSPFCRINYGLIENCSLASTYNLTYNGTEMAGICFRNEATGTLRGCGCTAKLSCSTGTVSGICHRNNGTIEGCFSGTPMTIDATTAAGICYDNYRTVKDCYFATTITGSSASWGGIVHTNRGTVEHCYLSSTGSITTSRSVGGIVNSHLQGRIDYCWTSGVLHGDLMGGIAATVNNANDTVVNCYCSRQALTLTNEATGTVHRGGGLVGTMSAGRLENCFIYLDHIAHVNVSSNTCVVGGLIGSLSGGTVSNCYVYETSASQRTLYGEKSGSPTITSCYVVGTDSDGGDYTHVSITSDASTSNANLATMVAALNSNAASIAYYKSWVHNSASTTVSIPQLSAYSE